MKKKIKSSHDACKAIVDLTKSYDSLAIISSLDPKNQMIIQIRNLAAAGIAADKAAEEAEDADLGRLIEKAEKDQGKFPFDELKLD